MIELLIRFLVTFGPFSHLPVDYFALVVFVLLREERYLANHYYFEEEQFLGNYALLRLRVDSLFFLYRPDLRRLCQLRSTRSRALIVGCDYPGLHVRPGLIADRALGGCACDLEEQTPPAGLLPVGISPCSATRRQSLMRNSFASDKDLRVSCC